MTKDNTPLNADDELHRKQQELYFNVDGVLTTLVLRTKRENMSVQDVKRRDEATERILAIIESDRKKHELQARLDEIRFADKALSSAYVDYRVPELKQELENL